MNEKILKLENLLQNSISELSGEFVSKRSGYDTEICNLIKGFKFVTTRYYDCTWEQEKMNIEFKKGTNIWLDLVRYSELLLHPEKTLTDTYTLFFIPDRAKERIVEIIGADTEKIIKKIGLTIDEATQLTKLHKNILRTLNAQANLTVKDVKSIANIQVLLQR